jgi:hypothetical protein
MAAKKRPKGMFKLPKSKCVKTVHPKRSFAKNFGFRYVQRKVEGSIVMIGCPKGKAKSAPYMKKKVKGKTMARRRMICTVGTKAFEVIKARKPGAKCPSGYKRRD